LQEDGRALGGTKEKHGVNLRDVDAFVEEINGEEDVHVSVPKRCQTGSAILRKCS